VGLLVLTACAGAPEPAPGEQVATVSGQQVWCVGDGRVVLVAHSSGGYPARVYADRHPARVAGLVLVDGTEVTVVDAGHQIPTEAPDAVVDAVRWVLPD
jgi:predicted alpha/beta hydrolase family esterase